MRASQLVVVSVFEIMFDEVWGNREVYGFYNFFGEIKKDILFPNNRQAKNYFCLKIYLDIQ